MDTEDRILVYFLAGENMSSYFRKIQQKTKISPMPLKKALDRLVKKDKLLVINGSVGWEWTRRKVRYRLPTKQYCIASPQNIERINAINKKKQDRIKEKQQTEKKRLHQIEQSKKNRLTKLRWSSPFHVRNHIAMALARTEYLGEDEDKVLHKIEITKKTYESWIKRSPRLQKIRELLRDYKNKKKELPFKKVDGQYKIPEFAIWIKRDLLYPIPTKKKHYQWYRHLHTKF